MTMRLNKIAATLAAATLLLAPIAAAPAVAEEAGAAGQAHEGGHELRTPPGGWSFEGPFGKYDRNALQRGLKVYREVCSNCHGMKLVAFRNLGQPGGPFFDEKAPNPNDNPIGKAIAADYKVPGIDPETGDPTQNPAKTSDVFRSPFPNETAARAGNGGALPPDLSVMAKARHGGASYIYSLLTGYRDAPEKLTVNPGQHYNIYFAGDTGSQWAGDPRKKPPGGFLAMNPPLPKDGIVTFDDGLPQRAIRWLPTWRPTSRGPRSPRWRPANRWACRCSSISSS